MPSILAYGVLAAGAGVLALLIPFALHRAHLLMLARRPERALAEPWSEADLPRVTIQLPVFNERHVIERLIDAACGIDYPLDRLEIQVLDDSTDDTARRAAARISAWRTRGVDAVHIRRHDRSGFKAGALAAGSALARGEFILVLDADFVPEADLVRRLLPPFRDEGVGMVQARWTHLNEEASAFTRAQALVLDGHFFWEQGGRYRGGRFFNFNGTAGMWRRTSLEAAGGWSADTLTEDLDLSYRAQMAGWRFVFLEDVTVPGEVPLSVSALEVQQRRWAEGGIQTARKILPRLLGGSWPRTIKAEAVAHLLGHLAHPLTLALGLLLFPAALARRSLGLEELLWLDLPLFLAATAPFVVFYARAGRAGGRRWREVIPSVARTLALGIGLSAPVSLAVLRGLGGRRGSFERTPKWGGETRSSYRARTSGWELALKLAAAALSVAYVVLAVLGGYWPQLPFMLLFASGYVGLGLPVVVQRAAEARSRLQGEEQEGGPPQDEASPERLRPDPGVLIGV